MDNMDELIASKIRVGSPVLVYDSDKREGETDIVVASKFVTSNIINLMRKDGGGLICTTMTYETSQKLGIPFMVEILQKSGYEIFKYLYPNDIPYDEKSSFSITINHRKTFTGIPDNDRSLTIREFANFIEKMKSLNEKEAMVEFGKIFRSPGHVHLLIASKDLLNSRKGHTELSTSLMIMSNVTPSATIVEMLGNDGKSLSYLKAKNYAMEHNYPFIEGSQIMDWWEKWLE